MDFVAGRCPEITELEVGAGGFAPRPHCPVEELLDDAGACERWLGSVTGRGFRVSALNVSGNPLDPLEPGPAHDRALRDAVRLSARLGVDRIVAMVGCPAGRPGDATAHFDAGGWLPYLAGVYERQWESELRPYWLEHQLVRARAENPGLLICIELHPGTGAHNVETFLRFAGLGPNIAVNLDPSHLFWQGMDPLAVLDGRAAGRQRPREGRRPQPGAARRDRAPRPPLDRDRPRRTLDVRGPRPRPRRRVVAHVRRGALRARGRDDLDRARGSDDRPRGGRDRRRATRSCGSARGS